MFVINSMSLHDSLLALSAEIREAFEILDEDRDGKLSLEDMKTLLQSQFMIFTDTQATEVVRQLDQDGMSSKLYSLCVRMRVHCLGLIFSRYNAIYPVR